MYVIRQHMVNTASDYISFSFSFDSSTCCLSGHRVDTAHY